MEHSTALEILRQGRKHSRWNEAFSFMLDHDPQFQSMMTEGLKQHFGFRPADLARHVDADGNPLLKLDSLDDAFGISKERAQQALNEMESEIGPVTYTGAVHSKN